MQTLLFDEPGLIREMAKPPKTQLLKWIGNKQRFARKIVSFFPDEFKRYHEPFLGSGAVLAILAKAESIGADSFAPLIEIWQTLTRRPATLKQWYEERWHFMMNRTGKAGYEAIKASYNSSPNAADLLFLCRSCYGGVVRFRQADGHMSTPCGIHKPISPVGFSKRVDEWHVRVKGMTFVQAEYRETMDRAKKGDLVYCDPPYSHTQSILYGAQSFSLKDLFDVIGRCKSRGVFVALSIDGSKRSGKLKCALPPADGLFEREVLLDCGRSMLKRFQMNGLSLEEEVVHDRLLLTY
ncbi:MAG: DNA adenine methylase [Sedimentisphaerales bacterium]|nr:DNA adenine methylase [Sedimentisphaerales bacterium]